MVSTLLCGHIMESPEAEQTKSECEKLLCAIKAEQNNDLT